MTDPSVARPSLLRARLTAGKPSFGVVATIPSVQSVQVLADAGVDWLLIDMEHSPIDLSSAHAMIMATSGTTTIPMVRIPWSNHWQAKTIMDLGALGVVVPMINTPEQAEAAVRSFRYPPAGNRLWGPFYAPMRWQQSMSEYIATANDNIVAIVTVEHPDAVRNIDEIMSVPGVDLAFIGPGDLAMALGIPGQFDAPAFKAVVAEAEAGILRSKVALGGVARTPDQAKEMVDRGYRAIALGLDSTLLHDATTTFLRRVRR